MSTVVSRTIKLGVRPPARTLNDSGFVLDVPKGTVAVDPEQPGAGRARQPPPPQQQPAAEESAEGAAAADPSSQ